MTVKQEYKPLPHAAIVRAHDSDILHVAHRYGRNQRGNVILADCGVMIVHYTYYPFTFMRTRDPLFDLNYILDAFTLCPRCGDHDTFVSAFHEMEEGRAKREVERKAEQEAEHERRMQALIAQALDLKAITRALISSGFDARFIDEASQSTPSVEIDYGDFVYTITPLYRKAKD